MIRLKHRTQGDSSSDLLYEKFWKKIPPKYELLAILGGLTFFVLLLYFGIISYSRTILPYCFEWIYYLIAIFCIPLIISLWKISTKEESRDFSSIYGIMYLKTVIVFTLILSIVFIPNRCLLLGNSSIYDGIVVDEDYIVYTKSSSSYSNLIKIQLIPSQTSIWYDLNKNNKPLGRKCIVSVRRGIFGMRYVENVDFLAE